MSNLAVTNTLSSGATILASEHNTNYSDIVTYINNRNSGSATWDTVSVASASNVPLVLNNSTGTQDIIRLQDNGTNVFVIEDGGVITTASQSAARAYRNSSTQSLSSGVDTKVQFNAETYDVKGEFDSSTNYRFTATKAGKYIVTSSIELGTSVSANIKIFVNGSSVSQESFGVPANGTICITDVVSLSATNYVEIYVNSLASANTVVNGEGKSFVAIHKVA